MKKGLIIKRATIVITISCMIPTIIGLYCFAMARQRETAAEGLLAITRRVVLGSTKRANFIADTREYRRYMVNPDSHNDNDGVSFRIYSTRWTGMLLVVRVNFTDGKATERLVGMGTRCCTVQTIQDDQDDLKEYPGAKAIRETRGNNPNILRFFVPASLDVGDLDRAFDYKVKCFSLFSHCDSVEEINPNATMMLSQSIAAGA